MIKQLLLLSMLCSNIANAQCIDAFTKETGLSLTNIGDLEKTLSQTAKVGAMRKGTGSIFVFAPGLSFAGQKSAQTIGYLNGQKVSAITLGFTSPINASEFISKHGLAIKSTDPNGITIKCEDDISFFLGKFGSTNAAMIKSISEVDAIVGPNL